MFHLRPQPTRSTTKHNYFSLELTPFEPWKIGKTSCSRMQVTTHQTDRGHIPKPETFFTPFTSHTHTSHTHTSHTTYQSTENTHIIYHLTYVKYIHWITVIKIRMYVQIVLMWLIWEKSETKQQTQLQTVPKGTEQQIQQTHQMTEPFNWNKRTSTPNFLDQP